MNSKRKKHYEAKKQTKGEKSTAIESAVTIEIASQNASPQNKAAAFILITASACLMYAMSSGLRSVYGIMLPAVSAYTGIAYTDVSFVIAVGQFVFGIAQPAFGILAIKKSNCFVLITGCLCMAAGLAAIPFCTSSLVLMLFFGILLPIGTGAVSFGMIMGAVTPKLGEEKAAAASDLISGSSGLGSIILSPLIQAAFTSVGLSATMLGFGILMLAMVPISLIISGKPALSGKNQIKSNKSSDTAIMPMLYSAFRSKDFWCLMIGFFTCGFHMAIIETHLFSQILGCGIAETTAAFVFSIYGIASVIGSLLSGALSMRFPMKYVVGTLYGSRVVWVIAFLLLPKNIFTITVFCILLGMTGNATVTPTSGLVGKLFGAANIPTLFGIVSVSHQTGSFLSAWLGGKCFEITGNYTVIWLAAAMLSLIAMLASYRIKENK